MKVRLRITLPSRAREHQETAFYRVRLSTTRGRGSAWKDFRGKKAKSHADAYAERWMRRRVAKHQTANVDVKRITKDIEWMYR